MRAIICLCALWLALPVWSQNQGTPVPFDLPADEAGLLVDLRHLNHIPAGRHGRLQAAGEALQFADGTPARFWGVNLQANALFGTNDRDIADHAERLARMGVNLVRLHHHDSDWVRLNVFGRKSERTGELNDAAMERLDRWIAALRAEGIYIWLDLHVGRLLRPEDGIRDASELLALRRQPGDLRGFNFVNDDIVAEMQRFNAAYLGHVNRYTGLAYKDDPAIAVVLISNENDLNKHFAGRLLPGKSAPNHAARYMEAARAFAAEQGLDPDRVWRAWEPGPAKLFLNDLEHRFFDKMKRHLRAIGYEGLVVTSSFWGGMPLSGLPSLSLSDMIDVHSYGRAGQLGADPAKEADLFSHIGLAQLAGKPLSISEWNLSPFPAPDRGVAALRMAALAAYQGWDMPVLYGYAQRNLSRAKRPGNWHAAADPTLIGALPVAALLFRGQQIRPASERRAFAPSAQMLYARDLNAEDLPRWRMAIEQHGVRLVLPQTPELPWLRPAPSILPQQGLAGRAQGAPLVSDTGEIRRVTGPQGLVVIDSPFAQVAAGHIPPDGLTLSGLTLEAPVEAPVLVAVQSLDGAPLSEARRVLLSVVSPVDAGDQAQNPTRDAPPDQLTLRFAGHPALRLAGSAPVATSTRIRHRQKEGMHSMQLDVADVRWVTLTRP